MKLSYLSVLLIFLFPVLLFFLTRGVVIHDEGYILHSSERLLNGLIPYRDFNFVYTPGSLFLTSASFAIFGPSILTSRILMVCIASLSSFLIFKIILISTKNRFYATLGVFLFVSWGPTHINFSWPVMYVFLVTFIFCYLLLKFLESKNNLFLFAAGFTAFTIFVFKQNFGVAIILPIIIFFLTKNFRKMQHLLTFVCGYLWGVIGFVIYLLSTTSFPSFLNDFYFFTIHRIIIVPHLTTPFIYFDASLIKTVFRTTFYLIPLIISVASLFILFIRKRYHLFFLSAFVISFYFVGIRPTTDYVHLSPILSLTGIPLTLILRFNTNSILRFITILSSVILITLGFHTALHKGYYRWDDPLVLHNNFFMSPKVNIFLNDKFYNEFSEIIETINKDTAKGDYIFVNSYNPMIYFISDRNDPMRNDFLKTQVDEKEYYEEVLGNLVAKKVRILILDYNNLPQLPIKDYVLENYILTKTIGSFEIYLREN